MHQIDFVGPRHIKGYGPINSLHLKDVIGRQAAGNQYAGKSMDNVIDFLSSLLEISPNTPNMFRSIMECLLLETLFTQGPSAGLLNSAYFLESKLFSLHQPNNG
jgi:hypothetical protein